MGKFGWSYPAGCDGPPDYEGQCEICGLEAGQCVCPVCPECGAQGDLKCYREHGLKSLVTDETEAGVVKGDVMWHAVCEVCRQSLFTPEQVVAYQIRNKVIVRIDLEGREPWSGIRVVCFECLRHFWQWTRDIAPGR